MLTPLEEIYGSVPKGALGAYGFYLKDTALSREEGFSELPRDTVICLKYAAALQDTDASERDEINEFNRRVFLALCPLD